MTQHLGWDELSLAVKHEDSDGENFVIFNRNEIVDTEEALRPLFVEEKLTGDDDCGWIVLQRISEAFVGGESQLLISGTDSSKSSRMVHVVLAVYDALKVDVELLLTVS